MRSAGGAAYEGVCCYLLKPRVLFLVASPKSPQVDASTCSQIWAPVCWQAVSRLLRVAMGRRGELSRKTPVQMPPHTPPSSVAKKAEHSATAQRRVVVAMPALSEQDSNPAPEPFTSESAAPVAGALRISTLNIGGRNTNSFEFLMAGDGSAIGQQWSVMYDAGMKAINDVGPAQTSGLADAVAEVLALAGDTDEAALIPSLMAKPTWAAVLAEATEAMPRVFNALNMASLGAGRPSPLERPDNVKPEIALLEQWLAWLKVALPKHRPSWEDRIKRKTLPTLPTCLAAMLLFDTMCEVAVKAMYASAKFGDAMKAHVDFHAKLAFTSDAGKLSALMRTLESQDYPEVVCLQEAAVLTKVSDKLSTATDLRDKYDIFSSRRESVLLLRKGVIEAGILLPEEQWRTPLLAAGEKLSWDLSADWKANVDKTCVVTTTWGGQRVALVVTHLKPTGATPAFLVALRRELESFPLVLIGMDANTIAGQQRHFSKFLTGQFLAHTAKPKARLTVCKQRTCFQTQLTKVKLDAAMKDWVCVYRHDWGVKLSPTQYTPALSRDSETLLPTSEWPFDHAMVSTYLAIPTPADTGSKHTALAKLMVRGLIKVDTDSQDTDRSEASDSESTESFDKISARIIDDVGNTFHKRFDTTSGIIAEMFRTMWSNPRKAAETFNSFFQITVITLAMGFLEIDDRRLLAFFAATMILVVTLGILILNLKDKPHFAIGMSLAFFFLMACFMVLMHYFSLKIEGLDRFAWKFDEERKKLLNGVAEDERGPPSFAPKEPPKQDSDDIDANLANAMELLHAFRDEVLEGLKTKGSPAEPRVIKFSVKGSERAFEKARLDYNNDGSRVTDLLRGCVVCTNSIAEVRSAYAHLIELEQRGVITILQNKNRYADGPTITGYLDGNVRIRFKGHVAEVQILVDAFYQLKNDQTPLYNLTRTIGLVGPVDPNLALLQGSSSKSQSLKLPRCTRFQLAGLRTAVGLGAVFPATGYPWALVIFEVLTNGVVSTRFLYGIDVALELRLIFMMVLMMPYMIIGFLATRDMCNLEGCGTQVRMSMWGFLFFGAFAVVTSVVTREALTLFGVPSTDPRLLIAAAASFSPSLLYVAFMLISNATLKGRRKRQSEKQRSRVGLLYDRYFGIRGSHFVWKVACVQLLTVALQVPSKMAKFARASTLGGPLPGTTSIVQGAHLVFLFGVLVNCLYPPILLSMSTVALQREASAKCDLLLDCIYIWSFLILALQGDFSAALPLNPMQYMSCFWPVVHIFTAGRAIEAAVTTRVQERQARAAGHTVKTMDVRKTRLPHWAAAAYLATTLGVFGASLAQGELHELWPLSARCEARSGPGCSCSFDQTTIYSCRHLPALYLRIGDHATGIVFYNSGLRAIHPRAFQAPAFADILTMYLERNELMVIEPGTFHGLASLKDLHLSSNRLSSIDGVIDGLDDLRTLTLASNDIATIAPATFTNLTGLTHLDLSSNRLSSIDGRVDDLRNLATLELDNNVIRSIRPGSLDGLTRLTELHLSTNLLTTIDGVVDGLYNLQTLDLANNDIESIAPGTFAWLTDLTRLSLARNSLTTVELNGLTSLNHLDFSSNRISMLEPVMFAGLRRPLSAAPPPPPPSPPPSPWPPGIVAPSSCLARGYTLAGRSCEGTTCSSWGVGNRCCDITEGYCGEYASTNPLQWVTTCDGLDFIRVTPGCGIEVATSTDGGGSRVTFYGDAFVGTNPGYDRVQSIRLFSLVAVPQQYSMPPLPPAVLPPPPRTTIILSNNTISSIVPGTFHYITGVHELDLSFNRLTSLEPGIFDGLENIEVLNLRNNLIGFIVPGIFKNLTNLTSLDLSSTGLSSLESGVFDGLENLETLKLANNVIGSIAPGVIAGLVNLRKVSFAGNTIECTSLVNELPAGADCQSRPRRECSADSDCDVPGCSTDEAGARRGVSCDEECIYHGEPGMNYPQDPACAGLPNEPWPQRYPAMELSTWCWEGEKHGWCGR